MNEQEYQRLVQAKASPSPLGKDLALAFLTGGAISVGGELLRTLYQSWGAGEDQAAAWVSVTLIALSALFTGLGWFDRLARWAGAGTLVPITGFANAVVSPALEFRSEGLITGVGARLFAIAGPVLVYGISASVVYGLILALM